MGYVSQRPFSFPDDLEMEDGISEIETGALTENSLEPRCFPPCRPGSIGSVGIPRMLCKMRSVRRCLLKDFNHSV